MNQKPRTIVLIPVYMLNEMLWREFETYLPANWIFHHACVTGGRTIHDIAQHMSTCLPDKFTLIGFSLGGYIARQEAEELVEAIPDALLRTIKGCGHMILLEQPEALARTITEWISVR